MIHTAIDYRVMRLFIDMKNDDVIDENFDFARLIKLINLRIFVHFFVFFQLHFFLIAEFAFVSSF